MNICLIMSSALCYLGCGKKHSAQNKIGKWIRNVFSSKSRTNDKSGKVHLGNIMQQKKQRPQGWMLLPPFGGMFSPSRSERSVAGSQPLKQQHNRRLQ